MDEIIQMQNRQTMARNLIC